MSLDSLEHPLGKTSIFAETIKSGRYFLITLGISLALFLILGGIASILRHNQNTIRHNIQEDLANVVAAKSSGDVHTECLVLSSTIAPDDGVLAFIIDPKMLVSADPCVGLQDALSGKDVNWVSYTRYWMGSDYLCLIALNFLSLSQIHILYIFLLCGSILSIFVSGLMSLRRAFWLPLMILAIGLLFGVGVAKFGGHVGHSPAYFMSMYAFSALIGLRFDHIARQEAVIIGSVIGCIVGFYDILSGAIPFTLALSVLLYYFLWKNANSREHSFKDLMGSILTMLITYILAVTAIMMLKLVSLLVLFHGFGAIIDFVNELTLRMSDQGIPDNKGISLLYVFRRLWWNSESVYIGGQPAANMIFLVGALSWLFLLFFSIRSYLLRRNFDKIIDFAVIFAASSIIVAWFLVFRNHGYGHAWFMTRVLCIIPTFGIVAATMIAQRAGAFVHKA